MTIDELRLEKIDLQLAIDKLVVSFNRRHPSTRVALPINYIWGEPQVTVALSLP